MKLLIVLACICPVFTPEEFTSVFMLVAFEDCRTELTVGFLMVMLHYEPYHPSWPLSEHISHVLCAFGCERHCCQMLLLISPSSFIWVKLSNVAKIAWLRPIRQLALFHCMVRHGTVRYGTVRYSSLLGGFPLGTVPGTWYFFSTTSVEVPSEPYRYQNVTCKLCWSLIGRRKSSLLRHWTCDTRPSSTALPARFKSAQPATDRTQLLFKQTHIFASTTK